MVCIANDHDAHDISPLSPLLSLPPLQIQRASHGMQAPVVSSPHVGPFPTTTEPTQPSGAPNRGPADAGGGAAKSACRKISTQKTRGPFPTRNDGSPSGNEVIIRKNVQVEIGARMWSRGARVLARWMSRWIFLRLRGPLGWRPRGRGGPSCRPRLKRARGDGDTNKGRARDLEEQQWIWSCLGGCFVFCGSECVAVTNVCTLYAHKCMVWQQPGVVSSMHKNTILYYPMFFTHDLRRLNMGCLCCVHGVHDVCLLYTWCTRCAHTIHMVCVYCTYTERPSQCTASRGVACIPLPPRKTHACPVLPWFGVVGIPFPLKHTHAQYSPGPGVS